MLSQKASMLVLLLAALLIAGCSGSDSGTNTDLGTGDPVAPGEVTIPANLKAAADAGDEGAQTVVALIEGIENLDSLLVMLEPSEQATIVGAPSFAPAADSTWEWTEGDLTYTLVFTETASDYHWELVANSSGGHVSFDNFVIAELTRAKDGTSGTFTLNYRSIAGFSIDYEWSISGETLTLALQMGTTDFYYRVVATVESDGSGEVLIYDNTELSAKVIWDGNGHGQWWIYSESDEGTF